MKRKQVKLKKGTKIAVTKSCCKYYRANLTELYGASPTGLFNEQYLPEMLMWAMSDIDPPIGQVNSVVDDGCCVSVTIGNRYGSNTDSWLDSSDVIVRKGRK